MKSIKSKMALVTVVLVAALSAMIILLSLNTYNNYKQLQISECQSLVDLEAERVNQDIRQLQENAKQLAMMGQLYYDYNRSAAFGEEVVVDNFTINRVAVGGGIWYEPYAIYPDEERHCYYAYRNQRDEVVVDESFLSEEYHYPTQVWYTSIKGQLAAGDKSVAWTPPYVDGTGTNSLMTTVGGGIYDKRGNFVGMSTVDWQLGAIAKRIGGIRPTPGSFVLFADIESNTILALSGAGLPDDAVGLSLDSFPALHPLLAGAGQLMFGGREYLCFSRTLDNGMRIMISVPSAELFKDINRSLWVTVLVLALSSLVMLAVIYLLLNRFINRPVAYLSQKAGEIGGGNLDTRIELRTNDELAQLGEAFNSMAGHIKEYIENISAITAERERIGAELGIAAGIQASMLPSRFPAFPGQEEFDVFATMKPAKEVGGDFYDFFFIGEDKLAMVAADVSGKGMPAALFMVIAKTLIKNYAMLHLGPAEVFTRANRQLCEGNDADMFVTAFMAVLDIHTGEVIYANAGHNPPLLKRRGGAFAYLERLPGFVLAGFETTQYRQKTMWMNPGDCLYLYTDGVTEAENTAHELFGEERLLQAANRHAGGGLTGLLGGIKQDLDTFVGEAPQFDDITMLGLAYHGGRAQKGGQNA